MPTRAGYLHNKICAILWRRIEAAIQLDYAPWLLMPKSLENVIIYSWLEMAEDEVIRPDSSRISKTIMIPNMRKPLGVQVHSHVGPIAGCVEDPLVTKPTYGSRGQQGPVVLEAVRDKVGNHVEPLTATTVLAEVARDPKEGWKHIVGCDARSCQGCRIRGDRGSAVVSCR